MTDDDYARCEYEGNVASLKGAIKRREAGGWLNPNARMRYVVETRDHFAIAVYSLLLHRLEEAEETFNQTAQFYLQLCQSFSPPNRGTFVEALQLLLLANQREQARELAREAPPDDSGCKYEEGRIQGLSDRREWIQALPLLILDQYEAARGHAEAARDYEKDLKKAWYPGLGDAILGIVNGEHSEFENGMARVLEKHNRQSSKGTVASPDRFLCLPAAAMALLAEARGWTVPDMPIRRKKLKFGIGYGKELAGLGQMEKKTVEVLNDSIPPALLGRKKG